MLVSSFEIPQAGAAAAGSAGTTASGIASSTAPSAAQPRRAHEP
ncbi:hypothetical protein [Sediminihabitans luteus]|nr:hypothetical protein [Sediminihabitans luteus]